MDSEPLTAREEAQMYLLRQYLLRREHALHPGGTRRKTDGAGVVSTFDAQGTRRGTRWGRERRWGRP